MYRKLYTWQCRFPSAVVPFLQACTCSFGAPLRSYGRCVVPRQLSALRRSPRVEHGPGAGRCLWAPGCASTKPYSRIWGRILPLIVSSPLQSLEGLEKGSHLRCHNHTAAAAASQLYLEKCCSCYRCGRVYTPQKLALTCQIARNLLW